VFLSFYFLLAICQEILILQMNQNLYRLKQRLHNPPQNPTRPNQSQPRLLQNPRRRNQSLLKPVQKLPRQNQKKAKDEGTVRIDTQTWAIANLNVSTFRNGDSIPEARTNKEWVAAGESGKPAWCYYNNDPASGPKYGKLYNWYAVNDPRGLAPEGWTLPGDADWSALSHFLGGQAAAGTKMKTTSGWTEGYNGTNESGFTGFPSGYRVENGSFVNLGSIGTWWSTNESKTLEASDHYLARSSSLTRGSNPKQRGESVRCLKK
jgi:uncharacterized protein (TIGR02145 family)